MSPIIKNALNLSEVNALNIEKAVERIDKYNQKVRERIDNYEIVFDGVQEKLEKVETLNNLIGYFKILQDIQALR